MHVTPVLHNSSEGMFLCLPEELYILSALFVCHVHSVNMVNARMAHVMMRKELATAGPVNLFMQVMGSLISTAPSIPIGYKKHMPGNTGALLPRYYHVHSIIIRAGYAYYAIAHNLGSTSL